VEWAGGFAVREVARNRPMKHAHLEEVKLTEAATVTAAAINGHYGMNFDAVNYGVDSSDPRAGNGVSVPGASRGSVQCATRRK